MRIFTLCLISFAFILSSSLTASPLIPAFSEPTDTLANAEYPANAGLDDETISIDSSAALMEAALMPTVFVQNDFCGMGTGFIDLTPAPGTQGPYVYMWSNGELTEDIFNLTPGVYTVTMMDANGVVHQAQAVVQSLPPISPQSITGVVTGNTLCNGSSDGTIDLSVSPTPNDWNYFWSNGETTMDIDNLPPGTYTVSVTWGVTCTTTATFVVPNLTNAPNLSPPIGGFGLDFCNTGNGTAAVFAQGGVPPYMYLWSNGATDLALNDLTAGTYTVTVTGANGCTSTLSGTVNPGTLPVNVSLASLVYNTTCNGANGSISINFGPPGLWTSSATFLWSNGETTQNLTGLSSGSYRVTVTRLGTCTATQVWFVEDTPIIPGLAFANTPATCGLSNGAVNLTPLAGGVPPYTYVWSNGATTQDLANVPAGDYTVVLTGANGCTATGTAVVEDNQPVFGFSGLVTDHNSCDTTNGRIFLSLFPSNLSYQWSNGATTTVLSNLAPGDYTVTVSAGGTCIETETFLVADLTEYPVLPAAATSTTCGLSNGAIDLEVTSGQTPFTYLWSNGMTTQDLSNLAADTFYVTVTSAVGCSNERMVIVPNVNTDITLVPNVLDNISCSAPTGSINLNISPIDSSLVYDILWSNGETSDSLFNLIGGTYMVTVTLGPTCIVSDTFQINEFASPPDLALGATPASCGLANGSTTLNVSGSAAPYTYLWSNGADTQDLSGLPPGNYTVTVTGANDCTAVSAINVLDNDIPLNITATTTGNASCTVNNGSIDITVTPLGTYQYAWSNGENTQDLNNLSPGTYTVNVSLGSCQSSSTYVVADNTAAPAISTAITAAICDANNGAIDLSVSGIAGPYGFLWSNNETSEDLTNILPGNYSVTVTGTDGCTAVANLNVPNNGSTFSLSGTASPLNNCAADNGAVDLNITPAGAYTILWSNGANTEDISNLSPGTYTVSVTESGVCTGTASFFIVDERINPITNQSIVPELCGLSDGSIDLEIIGGTAPYNFQWNSGQNSEDLNNISAGTYTVLITDANGCTASASATIPGNSISFALSGVAVSNTSCLTDNGSINLSVNPPAAYTYIWSEGSATEDLASVPAGTYTVTVSAGGNCSSTAEFTVDNNVPAPLIAENINAAVCGQANGSIDLTVSGSPAPYQYLWSNAELTQDLLAVVSGNYAVTVTAANGCTSVASFSIPETTLIPSIASVISASSSCMLNNGGIDLDITPALATGYNFNWSNGGQTENIFNLSAGTYTVTVNGGGACTNTAVFIVTSDVPVPILTESISAAFCGDASGNIDLSVTGASPAPYLFIWSNAEITEDLSAVPSGPYSVTVTAFNGCSTVETYTVPETTISPAIASSLSAATSCLLDNGSIDLSITPASATGYSFLWSNGSVTEDINNLAAGSYTVTVNGGGACTNTAVIVVPSDAPAPVLSELVSPALCGAASGSIDLSVSGASPAPYQFVWSNAEVTEDLSAVVSGPYSVTVTADNGCTTVETFTVPETTIIPVIASVLTSATSCVLSNGAIDLSITPASATGYSFLWSNGSATEDLSNIAAGSYTVTVFGGGACTNTAVIAVPSDTPSPILAENITAAFCGQASGSIDLSVSGSSPAPYTFAWSNAEVTQDLSAVVSGPYSVTVTADNGCTTVETYSVPETTILPAIASTITSASSCVLGNGAIDLTITPASALGYTFLWSNGSNTEDLSNVAAGTYTVTVNGGGACTNTAELTVQSTITAVALSGTANSVLCFGGNDGAIDLTVNSGTAPFVYNWSAGVPGNPEDPTGLTSGSYTVTVTDDLGCTSTAVFVIAQPASALQLQCTTTNPVSEPGFTDGTAEVTIMGGTGPYTVDWSPGSTQTPVPAGNFPILNLGENNYGVTVTDANGCPANCGFMVGVSACATTVGTMGSTLLSLCGTGCLTATYDMSGQVLGASDLVQFVLHQGNGNTIVNELARSNQPEFCFDPATMSYGTTYYISALAGVGDASGNVNPNGYCAVSSVGTPIRFQEVPVASAIQPDPLNCAVAQVALEGNSNLAGASFLWSTATGTIVGSPTQATVTAAASGTYTLVVTSNGCSNSTTVTVVDLSNNPQALITPQTVTVLDCSVQSLTLNGSASGATNPGLSWVFNGNPVGTGNSLTVNAPGQYQLIVVDGQTFCSATASIVVTQNLNLPALNIATPNQLTCSAPAQTLSGSSTVQGIQFAWATINGTDTTILGLGATLNVSSAGTYFLIGLNPANNCSNAVSVNVTANQTPPTANAGAPFTLDCAGEIASLSGSGSGAPNLGYTWSTPDGNFVSGSNTATPLIDLAGTYSLVVTNPANGCTAADVVVILPEIPVAYASVVQPTCLVEQGVIVVDSVTGLSNPILYTLNNGSPSVQTQFGNLSPGAYTLSVQGGNGCTATVSVVVQAPDLVEVFFLDNEAEINLGYSYQLETQVNIPTTEIASVSWTPAEGLSCTDCFDPIAMPLITTRYQVVVTSTAGCTARSEFVVKVDRDRKVFAPNIFSPNDDGNNDVFTILGDPVTVLRIRTLQVFSRWGEAVYERRDFSPNEPNIGWDGTHRGQRLNPAVFVWQAVVEFADGQEEVFTGDVLLKR